MLNKFEGRVAVITGAGSGFGREFALIGARRGMKLVLADVQADALDETAAMLRDLDADFRTQITDVAEFTQVEALRDLCVADYGVPHLLFNNAGVASVGRIWENDVSDWNWVMGVNLMGVAHGVRAFVPGMLAQNQAGHIVNTASVAGLVSTPNLGVYNVSKHGVVALSETLCHDLHQVNSSLGVSVLCPAFVPTGIAHSQRNRPQSMSADSPLTSSMKLGRESLEKAVASGRISATEVAEMTFAAITENQFYIVTHDAIMPSIRLRAEDVALGRYPTDPFSMKPYAAPRAPEANQ